MCESLRNRGARSLAYKRELRRSFGAKCGLFYGYEVRDIVHWDGADYVVLMPEPLRGRPENNKPLIFQAIESWDDSWFKTPCFDFKEIKSRAVLQAFHERNVLSRRNGNYWNILFGFLKISKIYPGEEIFLPDESGKFRLYEFYKFFYKDGVPYVEVCPSIGWGRKIYRVVKDEQTQQVHLAIPHADLNN